MRNSRIQPTLRKERVLALDIATHCGYYSLHKSGTWNFTESKRRNDNKEHKAFRDTLMAFIKEYDIEFIVAEDVNVGGCFSGMRKLSEFRGILLEVCDELDLPEPEFVNVTSLKKWATGDGRADKNKMIKACQRRYNVNPVDDNEADACHIFHFFLKKYMIK